MSTFDHTHPVIIKVIFRFPEFAPVCEKISSIHQFILEIQQILEPHDLKGHTCF